MIHQIIQINSKQIFFVGLFEKTHSLPVDPSLIIYGPLKGS